MPTSDLDRLRGEPDERQAIPEPIQRPRCASVFLLPPRHPRLPAVDSDPRENRKRTLPTPAGPSVNLRYNRRALTIKYEDLPPLRPYPEAIVCNMCVCVW